MADWVFTFAWVNLVSKQSRAFHILCLIWGLFYFMVSIDVGLIINVSHVEKYVGCYVNRPIYLLEEMHIISNLFFLIAHLSFCSMSFFSVLGYLFRVFVLGGNIWTVR